MSKMLNEQRKDYTAIDLKGITSLFRYTKNRMT